jgi:hypothetical protein
MQQQLSAIRLALNVSIHSQGMQQGQATTYSMQLTTYIAANNKKATVLRSVNTCAFCSNILIHSFLKTTDNAA